MSKVSAHVRIRTRTRSTAVCVSGSPAVECSADVTTRNEGLRLNLEGEKQRRRVIREEREEDTNVEHGNKG